MTPDVDFPAAHSRDADWFAVDADGCVGVFDTDENAGSPVCSASRRSMGTVPPVLRRCTAESGCRSAPCASTN